MRVGGTLAGGAEWEEVGRLVGTAPAKLFSMPSGSQKFRSGIVLRRLVRGLWRGAPMQVKCSLWALQWG